MVTKILNNTATTSYQEQGQILFHWLTYVNGFTLVEAFGANWTPAFYSDTNGVINSATPQQFYAAAPVFNVSFVGKTIAIRDSLNPTNCFIAKITAFVSPTQITLDATAVLNVNATAVEYRVFDTAAPPAIGDFFVIQSPTPLAWQARIFVDGVSTSLHVEFGFNGGWDVGTHTWLLPVSSTHYLDDTRVQTFCISDSAAGFVYLWSEETGGVGSNRNAMWFGNLSPFHSPAEVGVPKDTAYAAIFGAAAPSIANNTSRDTTIPNSFCIGEMLNSAGATIQVFMAQKRLLSTGVDMLANAAAAIDPRSLQTDDYDAIAFHRAPDQAWRGRVLGVRLLNNAVLNRTPINANGSYVLGGGIGATWNGKAPLP